MPVSDRHHDKGADTMGRRNRITDYIDIKGEKHAREVTATGTGAWGEYELRDSEGRLLGWIQKDTDRPTSREWTVTTPDFAEVGAGYPTLRDAITRGGKAIIERGQR